MWTWARRVGLTLLVLVVLVVAASGAYLGWDRLIRCELDVAVPGFTVDAAGVPTHVEHWPRAPVRAGPAAGAGARLRRVDLRLVARRRRCSPPTVTSTPTTCAATAGPTAFRPTPRADTDQLAGVLSALHLTRPVVVGHSLGVAIALSLALRDPSSSAGWSPPTATAPRTSATTAPARAAAARGVAAPAGRARRDHGRGPAPRPGPRARRRPVRTRVPGRRRRDRPVARSVPAARGPSTRWRDPRRPLIGLTDAQETTVAVPAAIVYAARTAASPASRRRPPPRACAPP